MSSMKRHPVDHADLLLYTEGELSGSVSSRMHSHIISCPGCQAELEKLQDGIKTLIEFRKDFALLVPAPPSHWGPLDVRIESWEKRWRVRSQRESLGAMLRPRYGLAAMLAMLLLIVCLIALPWHETVSANELLARAIGAQNKSLSGAQGRVVHERLQIHRRSGTYSREKDNTIVYESWQDGSHSRFQETSSSAEITNELMRVYQANHLDWKSPLSAAAYEKWQNSLPEKHDSVAHNGSTELTLTTFVSSQAQGDAIGKAQSIVGVPDWLPRVVNLWLRDREYEISEVNSELLPLSQVDPSLLDAPAVLLSSLNATVAAPTAQPIRPSPMKDVFGSALAPRLPTEQTAKENGKPSTQAVVLDSAPEQAVADNDKSSNGPLPLQNAPDAPSHTLRVSRALTSDLVWQPGSVTSSAIPTPMRPRETGVTLTYQPDNVERPLSGLQSQLMPMAPILLPEATRHDPFKAFRSSTVVNSLQKPRPQDCNPLKTLGVRLGLLKKKKTTSVASSKPGG